MSEPLSFDIAEILKILPHRYPFLLVDRVTEMVPGERVKAYKNLTFNEPFFQGHFPGVPVMPGVLIIEALAQAGVLLVVQSTPEFKDNPDGPTADEFLRKMLPIPDQMNILCAVAIGYTTFTPADLPAWDKEAHVHRL